MSPYLRVVDIQRTFLKVLLMLGCRHEQNKDCLVFFMRLSWCETCDVATSRCRMLLSSFGCPGENALRYKEWTGKCSGEKKERKTGLTNDVASTLTNPTTFSPPVLAPLAFFRLQFKAGSCGKDSSFAPLRCPHLVDFFAQWQLMLHLELKAKFFIWSFFVLNFEADEEWPNEMPEYHLHCRSAWRNMRPSP